MGKEFTDKTLKEYDFWFQRERFLNGLEVAAQNRAKAAELHETLARLHEQIIAVKATSRILRTKLITTLNKHNFL